MEVIDTNINNIYVIKCRLADLRQLNGGHFEYVVGDFLVQIFAYSVQEQPIVNTNLAVCSTVDAVIKEKKKGETYYTNIVVGKDPRFKDYTPIQYAGYNHYDLNKMPLINLCELIKYLHKLSKLAVFM